MEIKVPDHITDKEEIAAWIAEMEEQQANVQKIKETAKCVSEKSSIEVEPEVEPAPVKKATRSRKKK